MASKLRKGKGLLAEKKKEPSSVKEFVAERDWAGAITLLEFQRKSGELKEDIEWLPYCAFHAGDYKRAAKLYKDLISSVAAAFAGSAPGSASSTPPPANGTPATPPVAGASSAADPAKPADPTTTAQPPQPADGTPAATAADPSKPADATTAAAAPAAPAAQQSTGSAVPAILPLNKRYLHTFLACCYFFMGMYKDAQAEASKDDSTSGPSQGLRNRLMFHLAHRFGDEQKLMQCHQQLTPSLEDQLCLASVHCLRSHYQEAIDVYKRFLLDHKDYLALNVYVALCYYKLDYFDVSHEVLNVYLGSNPESPLATNLKACNHYKSYNGKAGETELKRLTDLMATAGASAASSKGLGQSFAADLVRHNMVVFRGGENALQVLPPLLGVIPEAQLNLVVYYLKNDEVDEAFQLVKDLEPATSQEYTIKGVVNAAYGQKHDSHEHLKMAQQYFQLVGSSPSECDTIPGRQCMASCFFLLKQFEDVLIYLSSIKSYFTNDDDFNWDFGLAKAHQGDYRGAEEALLLVQNEQYKTDYCYIGWLARCYIMNGKAYQAWELYLKMETSPDSFNLLQLIANDSYKMGAFYYSAKAFDVLERLDGSPEYWVGKRGACVGVFQQVIATEETKEHLRDVVAMLKTSHNPQVESILKVMRKWGKDNNVRL